ncbi:MAG: Mov34/MPN/PAD-1 family protein [Candidatus Promineifilaceae bacterium]
MTSSSSNAMDPYSAETDPHLNSEGRALGDDDVKIQAVPFELPHGRPPIQDDCVLHGALPADRHPHVVVSQLALSQVRDHSMSNTRVELGGVLLGQAYQHNGQLFVEVNAAIPAESNDNGPVHFTFTADAWAQIHVDRTAYPECEVVGWFHTHPDLGVFFSADDEVVHAAAFTQPWHVGLVVDPVRDTASFFGWAGDIIRSIPGFYELIPASTGSADEVPRSVVSWDVSVDDSWYMPRPHTTLQKTDMHGLPLISPWVGAILGGTSLVVSLITLILFFLSSR